MNKLFDKQRSLDEIFSHSQNTDLVLVNFMMSIAFYVLRVVVRSSLVSILFSALTLPCLFYIRIYFMHCEFSIDRECGDLADCGVCVCVCVHCTLCSMLAFTSAI